MSSRPFVAFFWLMMPVISMMTLTFTMAAGGVIRNYQTSFCKSAPWAQNASDLQSKSNLFIGDASDGTRATTCRIANDGMN